MAEEIAKELFEQHICNVNLIKNKNLLICSNQIFFLYQNNKIKLLYLSRTQKEQLTLKMISLESYDRKEFLPSLMDRVYLSLNYKSIKFKNIQQFQFKYYNLKVYLKFLFDFAISHKRLRDSLNYFLEDEILIAIRNFLFYH